MPNFILLLCTCYTCNDNKAESKVDCNISVAHTLNDMWSLLLYVELWVQLHESAKWKIHYSLAFISYREKKVTNRKCLMEKQRFKKKKHVLNATSTVVSRHEQQPYILYIYNLFLLKKTSNNLWSDSINSAFILSLLYLWWIVDRLLKWKLWSYICYQTEKGWEFKAMTKTESVCLLRPSSLYSLHRFEIMK